MNIVAADWLFTLTQARTDRQMLKMFLLRLNMQVNVMLSSKPPEYKQEQECCFCFSESDFHIHVIIAHHAMLLYSVNNTSK